VNICFICTDYGFAQFSKEPKSGGSCFARCVLPARGLTENGHFAEWYTGLRKEVDGSFGACRANHGPQGVRNLDGEPVEPPNGKWDVVVLKYLMYPDLAQDTLRARASGQIVVQDVDDDMWRIGATNAAKERTDPKLHPNWNRDHLLAGLQVADLVTVTNSYLETALRREGVTSPIKVIPNTIDLREWTRQPIEREVTRVGWVGMTGFRNNDLEQVGPGLRMFLERHRGITFVHGGRRPDFVPAHRPLKVPQSRMEYREQQPMDQYPRLWDWLDLAIAPISPIEFNLSKTAIKVMEGSAAGVPMLASDFGPYREWAACHLVPEKREWDKRLEVMLDYDMRRTWEAVQYERVQREDLAVRWSDWADTYGALL